MIGPRTRGLLALLLVLVAALAWLAYEVANDRTIQFDLALRDAIHQHASPPLTRFMKLVTFIGRLYSVLPLAAGVIVVLWRTGLKREAWVLAFVMAGEVPIEQVLKWAIHRPRPSPFFSYALPSSYSFPSGHALASVLLFGTLAALLAPHIRGKSNKLLLWLAAALMIAAIGFSRVYLGVHYPTDVIAGYAAGLAWVLTVWSVRSSGAGILSNAPHDS